MSTPPIVLASRSPRRLELLRNAGLEPIVVVSDTEEIWRTSEDAIAYAARVAREKLHATANEHRTSLPAHARLLAADTTVWIPGTPKPLGKPENRNAARRGLMQLFAAKEHAVTTAFCIGALGDQGLEILAEQSVTTRVEMRTPSDAELDHYLDTLEWSDKAGGYGIQGAAAGFVTRLEGSYTNVVGLPLAEVLDCLRQLSAIS